MGVLSYHIEQQHHTTQSINLQNLLGRIGVQAPYFALENLTLEGLEFRAVAYAESPAFLEVGPMPAAELGRHAAIAGLCHVALEQNDDKRRYYLAKKATCEYFASDAPYGSAVTFVTTITSLTKRGSVVEVSASCEGQKIAAFELTYTILTEPAFQRLFKHRQKETRPVASPYRQLLITEYQRYGNAAEQVVPAIPAYACAGHFEHYPAMPVAVLMGQLSYLAGQLVADTPAPFKVVKGLVEATDLGWADEEIRFRAEKLSDGITQHHYCSALASGRPIGHMDLWLEKLS